MEQFVIFRKNLKRRAAAAAAVIAAAGGLALGGSGTASAASQTSSFLTLCNSWTKQVDVWDAVTRQPLFSVSPEHCIARNSGDFGNLKAVFDYQVWEHNANPGHLLGIVEWNSLTNAHVTVNAQGALQSP